MKSYIIGILSLLFAVVMTGCHGTIHEHPDEGNASVTLTMNVKKSGPELYKVIEYVGNERHEYQAMDYELPNTRSNLAQTMAEFLAMNSIDLDKWDLRLIWELYDGSRDDIRNGDARLLQRDFSIVNYDVDQPSHTITFDAPSGRYTLLAWADFVPKGSNEDFYYDTDDLNQLMSYLERRRNCTDNDQRDCFSQAYDFVIEDIDFEGQARHYETTLIRPQGRYVVLATDYEKYKTLTDIPVEENIVQVKYPSFVNVGYTVVEQRPNDGQPGLSYNHTPSTYDFDGNEMVCVADDYSFVNGEVSYVNINMGVYNPFEALLSTNKNIEIPLYADRLTVVIGKFLATSTGSGGINMDDGFEDEFVIPYAVDQNQFGDRNNLITNK